MSTRRQSEHVIAWVVTGLATLIFFLVAHNFIAHYTAVPDMDGNGYVFKVYNIADALAASAGAAFHADTYFSAWPAQRPPLLAIPPALLLGPQATPRSIETLWLVIRLATLLVGLWLLSGVAGHARFVPASLMAILGSQYVLRFNGNIFMMDEILGYCGLLVFALIVRDDGRRDSSPWVLAGVGAAAATLIKPVAPALLFPLFATRAARLLQPWVLPLGAMRRASSKGLPEEPGQRHPSGEPGAESFSPPSATHAHQHVIRAVTGVILIGSFVWLLVATAYGRAVVDVYRLGDKGWWHYRLDLASTLALLSTVVPGWLLIALVVSLRRHRRQAHRSAILTYAAAIGLWWYFFNFALAYSTGERLLFAAAPSVTAALLMVVCERRRAAAVVTAAVSLLFVANLLLVTGGLRLPPWARRVAAPLAPLAVREEPVSEVGLLSAARRVSAVVERVEPHAPVVRIWAVVADRFVEGGSLTMALRLVEPARQSRIAVWTFPLGSSSFDLPRFCRFNWFFTKGKRHAVELLGDALTSLDAFDRIITDPASPLHTYFQKQLDAPIHQPDLDDTLTLWYLRRPPSPAVQLAALRWVAPIFAGTPGETVVAREAATLSTAVARGTALETISPIELREAVLASPVETRGVRFGRQLALRATAVTRSPDGLRLTLVWESLEDQDLSYHIFVHGLDSSGRIRSNQETDLDPFQETVYRGVVWRQQLRLPSTELANVRGLGIGLVEHDTWTYLTIDRGPRDLDNHRLLIALPR